MPKRSTFLAVAALLFVAAPVAAQRSYTIDNFDANVVVQKNSDIDVTETLTYTFHGSYNGIYRKIPVEYRTPQGFNWTIRYDFLGASDAQGTPLQVEESRDGPNLQLKVWVPGANDATRTIVLHYRAANALRYFQDHDELYWNATGDEWDVALGLVSATVTLPTGATGLRYTEFNGAYRSAEHDAVIDTTGGRIHFAIPHPLGFREGMTVVVGWDKGLVAAPTPVDKVAAFIHDNWPVAIPIPFFFLMFFLWYTRGRDPRLRPITTLYEPPKGTTPGEAGTIIDDSVDMRDITATLVDLAVKGYLKIEEHDKGTIIGFHLGKGYRFIATNKDEKELTLHEQLVLAGVFRSGPAVELSDLTNDFYQSVPGVTNAIFDRLVDGGNYPGRPDRIATAWRVGGVVIGFLIFFLGSAVAPHFQLTQLPFIIAAVLTALILIGFGSIMPAKTEQGTRLLEGVLGYAEFLQRVDSDRFARVVKTPEMFEQGLPYAMALGVEGRWAKAFEGIYTTPPNWYVGAYPGHFSVVNFSSSMSSMSHAASAAMSSQPRTSSGSGFSGGGFSGGGGGGGGGGAF